MSDIVWSIPWSVIYTVFVLLFAITVGDLLDEGEEKEVIEKKILRKLLKLVNPSRTTLVIAGILTITTGAILILMRWVPKWGILLFMVAVVVEMCYNLYWWCDAGTTKKQLVAMILLQFLISAPGKLCAEIIAGTVHDSIESIPMIIPVIISYIPAIVFLLSVGVMIANRLWFLEAFESEDFDATDYMTEKELQDLLKGGDPA